MAPEMPYSERPYVPARDPFSAIPPSRHPFQAWTMFACFVGGLGNLLGSNERSAPDQLIDPFFVKVWAITLMFGGLFALIGAYWQDRITGLLLERVALMSIGISCPIYGVMVWIVYPGPSSLGGMLTFSVGVAALWRVVHVMRELRVVRHFIQKTGLHE